MSDDRPDDRRMKFLLDRMHSSSDAFASADHLLAEDAYARDADLRQQAQELKQEASRMMADAIREFLEEVHQRRHETGNFQYPFPPFDEFAERGMAKSRDSSDEMRRDRGN